MGGASHANGDATRPLPYSRSHHALDAVGQLHGTTEAGGSSAGSTTLRGYHHEPCPSRRAGVPIWADHDARGAVMLADVRRF